MTKESKRECAIKLLKENCCMINSCLAKEKYIKKVADEYKDKIPLKLYEALYNWRIEEDD